jgi:TonB family protein
VLPTLDPQPPVRLKDFQPTAHNGPILVPSPEPLTPARDASQMATVVDEQPVTGSSTVVPAAPPIRTIGTNQLPNSADYYPPDMRRLNVQGATNVRVCVDAQGAPLGDPTIEESSGFPRLDVGALNVAKHGRYTKSMQGGTPVGNCFRFRIAFKIPK